MSFLTNIIADRTGVDNMPAGLPGQRFPELADGECIPIRPDGCAGCRRWAVDHEAWQGCALVPPTKLGAMRQELEGYAEGVREIYDAARLMIELMHGQAHGVFAASALSVGLVPITVSRSWPLVGVNAAGTQVTVQHTAETIDPRAVEYGYVTQNPSWPAPGEAKWVTETIDRALPPMGWLTFSAPSRLQWHTGFRVYMITPPSSWGSFGEGDNFTFHILGTMDDGQAEGKWPTDSEDEISVTYTTYNYLTTRELWTQMRYERMMYGARQTYTVVSPSAGTETLSATQRVSVRSGDITATETTAGGTADATAKYAGLVYCENNSGNYKTLLDLTTVDLTGVLAIEITALEESTSDAAVACGQGRCGRDTHDPTGSWGDADGTATSYCALRDVASRAGNYQPGCYETACDQWLQEDSPTHPLSLLEAMINAYPWLGQQFAGFPSVFLSRAGHASLRALVEQHVYRPGAGDKTILNYQCGGWERAETVGGLARANPGLEYLEWLSGQAVPYLPYMPESQGSYGPGGGNGGKTPAYPLIADSNAFGTADWLRTEQACVVHGSECMDSEGNRTRNTIGKYQRALYDTAARRYTMWFPAIQDNDDEQTYDDGTVQRGWWDADGQPLESSEGAAYRWKVTISPRMRDPIGGTVDGSAEIYRARMEGGNLSLYFALGVQRAKLGQIVGDTFVDTVRTWKQGGNIVALPEYFRVRARGATDPPRGVDRTKARNGDLVRFPSANGFTGAIADRAFAVRRAEACAAEGESQSYNPADNTQTLSQIVWGRMYVPTAYGETVTGLEITRNGGAVTLTEYGNNDPDGRPYGLSVDQYYWEDWHNGVDQQGILIWFSEGQGDDDAAIHELAVEVTTSGGTYNDNLDLLDETIGGWDTAYLEYEFTAREDIDSVASVKIKKRGSGTEVTLTPYGSPPAEWSDWDQTHYYTAGAVDDQQTFQVSPMFSGDELIVTFNLDPDTLSSSDYYDQVVAPLGTREPGASEENGALPPKHKVSANFCDKLVLQDENGALAATAAVDFRGKDAVIERRLVAVPGTTTIHKAAYDVDGEDSEITDQCLMFEAQGVVFVPDDLAAGNCLRMPGVYADRTCMPDADVDVLGPRHAIERMLTQ